MRVFCLSVFVRFGAQTRHVMLDICRSHHSFEVLVHTAVLSLFIPFKIEKLGCRLKWLCNYAWDK